MNIAIGCDHAGYEVKDKIKAHFAEQGHTFSDKGTNGPESVDYPDFAHAVAGDVNDHKVDLGILICGSAQGVAMTANKHQQVRAAVVWDNEIAQLSRQHNNANVICLPARFLDEKQMIAFVETFTKTEFEGGRHERRVGKISC